jgi:hypothetical protein
MGEEITINVPLTQGQSPRFLYHFVNSIDTVKSIYGNREFWFKSISESNDPCERFFRSYPTPIYQACFSDSCDEEKLWDEYKCGICIQIKPCFSNFSINNRIDLTGNFMYRTEDVPLIRDIGGIKLGRLGNAFCPYEFSNVGDVLGPFPKNYIKDYENKPFVDPFLKALFKTSNVWTYQNEWRYMVNKMDDYFEYLGLGAFEKKDDKVIETILKVKLNKSFFSNSKVLYNTRLCSLEVIDELKHLKSDDFSKAITHQWEDDELVPFSEFSKVDE